MATSSSNLNDVPSSQQGIRNTPGSDIQRVVHQQEVNKPPTAHLGSRGGQSTPLQPLGGLPRPTGSQSKLLRKFETIVAPMEAVQLTGGNTLNDDDFEQERQELLKSLDTKDNVMLRLLKREEAGNRKYKALIRRTYEKWMKEHNENIAHKAKEVELHEQMFVLERHTKVNRQQMNVYAREGSDHRPDGTERPPIEKNLHQAFLGAMREVELLTRQNELLKKHNTDLKQDLASVQEAAETTIHKIFTAKDSSSSHMILLRKTVQTTASSLKRNLSGIKETLQQFMTDVTQDCKRIADETCETMVIREHTIRMDAGNELSWEERKNLDNVEKIAGKLYKFLNGHLSLFYGARNVCKLVKDLAGITTAKRVEEYRENKVIHLRTSNFVSVVRIFEALYENLYHVLGPSRIQKAGIDFPVRNEIDPALQGTIDQLPNDFHFETFVEMQNRLKEKDQELEDMRGKIQDEIKNAVTKELLKQSQMTENLKKELQTAKDQLFELKVVTERNQKLMKDRQERNRQALLEQRQKNEEKRKEEEERRKDEEEEKEQQKLLDAKPGDRKNAALLERIATATNMKKNRGTGGINKLKLGSKGRRSSNAEVDGADGRRPSTEGIDADATTTTSAMCQQSGDESQPPVEIMIPEASVMINPPAEVSELKPPAEEKKSPFDEDLFLSDEFDGNPANTTQLSRVASSEGSSRGIDDKLQNELLQKWKSTENEKIVLDFISQEIIERCEIETEYQDILQLELVGLLTQFSKLYRRAEFFHVVEAPSYMSEEMEDQLTEFLEMKDQLVEVERRVADHLCIFKKTHKSGPAVKEFGGGGAVSKKILTAALTTRAISPPPALQVITTAQPSPSPVQSAAFLTAGEGKLFRPGSGLSPRVSAPSSRRGSVDNSPFATPQQDSLAPFLHHVGSPLTKAEKAKEKLAKQKYMKQLEFEANLGRQIKEVVLRKIMPPSFFNPSTRDDMLASATAGDHQVEARLIENFITSRRVPDLFPEGAELLESNKVGSSEVTVPLTPQQEVFTRPITPKATTTTTATTAKQPPANSPTTGKKDVKGGGKTAPSPLVRAGGKSQQPSTTTQVQQQQPGSPVADSSLLTLQLQQSERETNYFRQEAEKMKKDIEKLEFKSSMLNSQMNRMRGTGEGPPMADKKTNTIHIVTLVKGCNTERVHELRETEAQTEEVQISEIAPGGGNNEEGEEEERFLSVSLNTDPPPEVCEKGVSAISRVSDSSAQTKPEQTAQELSTALEREAKLNTELATCKENFNAEILSYQQKMKDWDEIIGEKKSLEVQVKTQENAVVELGDELKEKNTVIAQLEANAGGLQSKINELKKEKASGEKTEEEEENETPQVQPKTEAEEESKNKEGQKVEESENQRGEERTKEGDGEQIKKEKIEEQESIISSSKDFNDCEVQTEIAGTNVAFTTNDQKERMDSSSNIVSRSEEKVEDGAVNDKDLGGNETSHDATVKMNSSATEKFNDVVESRSNNDAPQQHNRSDGNNEKEAPVSHQRGGVEEEVEIGETISLQQYQQVTDKNMQLMREVRLLTVQLETVQNGGKTEIPKNLQVTVEVQTDPQVTEDDGENVAAKEEKIDEQSPERNTPEQEKNPEESKQEDDEGISDDKIQNEKEKEEKEEEKRDTSTTTKEVSLSFSQTELTALDIQNLAQKEEGKDLGVEASTSTTTLLTPADKDGVGEDQKSDEGRTTATTLLKVDASVNTEEDSAVTLLPVEKSEMESQTDDNIVDKSNFFEKDLVDMETQTATIDTSNEQDETRSKGEAHEGEADQKTERIRRTDQSEAPFVKADDAQVQTDEVNIQTGTVMNQQHLVDVEGEKTSNTQSSTSIIAPTNHANNAVVWEDICRDRLQYQQDFALFMQEEMKKWLLKNEEKEREGEADKEEEEDKKQQKTPPKLEKQDEDDEKTNTIGETHQVTTEQNGGVEPSSRNTSKDREVETISIGVQTESSFNRDDEKQEKKEEQGAKTATSSLIFCSVEVQTEGNAMQKDQHYRLDVEESKTNEKNEADENKRTKDSEILENRTPEASSSTQTALTMENLEKALSIAAQFVQDEEGEDFRGVSHNHDKNQIHSDEAHGEDEKQKDEQEKEERNETSRGGEPEWKKHNDGRGESSSNKTLIQKLQQKCNFLEKELQTQKKKNETSSSKVQEQLKIIRALLAEKQELLMQLDENSSVISDRKKQKEEEKSNSEQKHEGGLNLEGGKTESEEFIENHKAGEGRFVKKALFSTQVLTLDSVVDIPPVATHSVGTSTIEKGEEGILAAVDNSISSPKDLNSSPQEPGDPTSKEEEEVDGKQMETVGKVQKDSIAKSSSVHRMIRGTQTEKSTEEEANEKEREKLREDCRKYKLLLQQLREEKDEERELLKKEQQEKSGEKHVEQEVSKIPVECISMATQVEPTIVCSQTTQVTPREQPKVAEPKSPISATNKAVRNRSTQTDFKSQEELIEGLQDMLAQKTSALESLNQSTQDLEKDRELSENTLRGAMEMTEMKLAMNEQELLQANNKLQWMEQNFMKATEKFQFFTTVTLDGFSQVEILERNMLEGLFMGRLLRLGELLLSETFPFLLHKENQFIETQHQFTSLEKKSEATIVALEGKCHEAGEQQKLVEIQFEETEKKRKEVQEALDQAKQMMVALEMKNAGITTTHSAEVQLKAVSQELSALQDEYINTRAELESLKKSLGMKKAGGGVTNQQKKEQLMKDEATALQIELEQLRFKTKNQGRELTTLQSTIETNNAKFSEKIGELNKAKTEWINKLKMSEGEMSNVHPDAKEMYGHLSRSDLISTVQYARESEDRAEQKIAEMEQEAEKMQEILGDLQSAQQNQSKKLNSHADEQEQGKRRLEKNEMETQQLALQLQTTISKLRHRESTLERELKELRQQELELKGKVIFQEATIDELQASAKQVSLDEVLQLIHSQRNNAYGSERAKWDTIFTKLEKARTEERLINFDDDGGEGENENSTEESEKTLGVQKTTMSEEAKEAARWINNCFGRTSIGAIRLPPREGVVETELLQAILCPSSSPEFAGTAMEESTKDAEGNGEDSAAGAQKESNPEGEHAIPNMDKLLSNAEPANAILMCTPTEFIKKQAHFSVPHFDQLSNFSFDPFATGWNLVNVSGGGGGSGSNTTAMRAAKMQSYLVNITISCILSLKSAVPSGGGTTLSSSSSQVNLNIERLQHFLRKIASLTSVENPHSNPIRAACSVHALFLTLMHSAIYAISTLEAVAMLIAAACSCVADLGAPSDFIASYSPIKLFSGSDAPVQNAQAAVVSYLLGKEQRYTNFCDTMSAADEGCLRQLLMKFISEGLDPRKQRVSLARLRIAMSELSSSFMEKKGGDQQTTRQTAGVQQTGATTTTTVSRVTEEQQKKQKLHPQRGGEEPFGEVKSTTRLEIDIGLLRLCCFGSSHFQGKNSSKKLMENYICELWRLGDHEQSAGGENSEGAKGGKIAGSTVCQRLSPQVALEYQRLYCTHVISPLFEILRPLLPQVLVDRVKGNVRMWHVMHPSGSHGANKATMLTKKPSSMAKQQSSLQRAAATAVAELHRWITSLATSTSPMAGTTTNAGATNSSFVPWSDGLLADVVRLLFSRPQCEKHVQTVKQFGSVAATGVGGQMSLKEHLSALEDANKNPSPYAHSGPSFLSKDQLVHLKGGLTTGKAIFSSHEGEQQQAGDAGQQMMQEPAYGGVDDNLHSPRVEALKASLLEKQRLCSVLVTQCTMMQKRLEEYEDREALEKIISTRSALNALTPSPLAKPRWVPPLEEGPPHHLHRGGRHPSDKPSAFSEFVANGLPVTNLHEGTKSMATLAPLPEWDKERARIQQDKKMLGDKVKDDVLGRHHEMKAREIMTEQQLQPPVERSKSPSRRVIAGPPKSTLPPGTRLTNQAGNPATDRSKSKWNSLLTDL